MLVTVISILFLCAGLSAATDDDEVVYDRYTATPASEELLAKYKAANITETCAIKIKKCNANERRRVDGSCNNLDNPARGTYFEPIGRMVPAQYSDGFEPRKASDGSELTPARSVRQALLCVGKSIGQVFTQAWTAYQIFTFQDFASIHDLQKTLQTDCCSEQGQKRYDCAPNKVLPDDPVHRFSGVRCINMTRPIIYSDYNCTDDPRPSPIQRGTSMLDMSNLYNSGGLGDKVIRSNVSGQLLTDVDENGIVWPPNGDGFCLANQPGEDRCFGHYSTALLQTSLLGIWWMRQHNYIAAKLHEVNPCWDDERLFQETREIIISFASQLYVYEYLTTLVGSKKLIEAGIHGESSGHRNVYDKTQYPKTMLEYTYAIRWFHSPQEGAAHMYDEEGNYMKSFPLVNGTFRPGLLGVDKNIVYFTKHMFLQPCGGFGPRVDPDLAELGQGLIQFAMDIPSNDLYRGRYLGFAPYVDYIEMCTGHKIESFDDLKQHMDKEMIDRMKTVYKNYSDVDLLAGIWVENYTEGGYVPNTLACIITKFILSVIQSDRYWYENPDKAYPLTKVQLSEVRKFTLAHLMCYNADNVTHVQRNAFYVVSDDNPLVPCSEIMDIDFTAWADQTCDSKSNSTTDDSSDTTSTSDASASSDSSSTSDTSTSDDTTTSDATASSESSSTSETSTSDNTTTSDATASSESSSTSESSTSDDSDD